MAASSWWPTPTSPNKWFTAEQIATSRAFHRPVAIASFLAATGAMLIAAGMTWYLRSIVLDYWVLALSPLAVLLPLLAHNWWAYARHSPRFGAMPALPRYIFLEATATTAALFFGVNVFWVLFRVVGVGVVGLLCGLCIGVLTTWAASGSVLSKNLAPAPPQVVIPFASLADWAGVKCQFLLESDSGSQALEANARATRQRGENSIVISPALLQRRAELQSLVIAHEISHLKHRHIGRVQLLRVGHGILWVLMAWTLSKVVGNRLDELWIYPSLSLGYMGLWWLLTPATAFVMRHFERQADSGSFELLGTVPTALARQLYGTSLANLSPNFWQRLFSNHPPPAERLELVARRIKAI